MNRIMETVPNFSEGRQREVIEKLPIVFVAKKISSCWTTARTRIITAVCLLSSGNRKPWVLLWYALRKQRLNLLIFELIMASIPAWAQWMSFRSFH